MSSTALFRPETDVARRRLARGGPVLVDTSVGTISLRVTGDLPSLASLWERLQTVAPCTAAQTYDWALAWTRHVLAPEGREPVVAVGHGADGGPLFLWPLEIAVQSRTNVLKWLGQDHANYNMGLFEPTVAQEFTEQDVFRILRETARQADAAAAILRAQPFAWDGMPNPFAKLPHQPSPNSGYAVTLSDFTALYKSRFSKRSRGTLDRKERKLLQMGPLHFGWAETQDEKLALLDTFFMQKSRQFAEMGIKEIFGPHERGFYREVALLEENNPSRLRLGYIMLGDAVLATFSGTLCHDRLSVVLSSLTDGDAQKQSPGSLLLRQQIAEAARQGLAFYDLGVGQARHKDEWCDVEHRLFDSFIAFEPQGLVVTLPLAVGARFKRAIKSNPRLWSLARKARQTVFGREADGA